MAQLHLLHTPLHATAAASERLHQMARTVRAVRRAAVLVVHAHAQGIQLCRTELLRLSAQDANPAVLLTTTGARVRTRSATPLTERELTQQLRPLRDTLGWTGVLPVSTIDLVIHSTARDARQDFPALPAAWGAETPPVIPYAGGVWPINLFQAQIHSLGELAVQACDVYALPRPYLEALALRQDRYLAGENRRLQAAEERFWTGDQDALRDVIRIAGRHTPAELRSRRPPVDAQMPDGVPAGTDSGVIRWIRTAWGQERWEIGHAFTSAQPRRPLIRDSIGVDVGARQLLTWSSSTLTGALPQTILQLPVPCDPRPHKGQSPTAHHAETGRARARYTVFRAFQAGYEQAVGLLLGHERVVLENINWRNFRGARFRFDEFALEAHLDVVLGWLQQLAPVTGTEIVWVPPAETSSRCSRPGCGRESVRPTGGRPFRCRHCGLVMAPDLNSSRNIRRLGRRPTDPR